MTSTAYWKSVFVERLGYQDNPFAPLQASAIISLCETVGYCWRERIWSPALTVMTFLYQVLSATRTCRSAVAMTLSRWALEGGKGSLPSADTSAYCQARKRLPLEVLKGLMGNTARQLMEVIREQRDLWWGRRIWLVDGSTLSMPDTLELQSVYPQSPRQGKGCGFPLMRIVGLFDWASGALVDVQSDSLYGHERHLFRRVWGHMQSGDIVVGDRGFSGYNDVAQLLARGIDSVFRIHQRRKIDYCKGRQLSHWDHVVPWHRLKQYKENCGIPRDEWETLPQSLEIREIRIHVDIPGFRTRQIDLGTTLLDPRPYPGEKIAGLYRQRWMIELNFRSLKTEMNLEILRGKTVDVVRKELLMHVVAYNLIRYLMWLAAREHGRDLHRLSFTGTLQRVQIMWVLFIAVALSQQEQALRKFLEWIAKDTVPDRPERQEPRRLKRRGKEYSFLMKPRSQYKARKGNMDFDAR